MQPEIIVRATPQEVAQEAERLVIESCRDSVLRRAAFRFCLTGGSSPNLLYQRLAAHGAQIDWARTHVYWGDERAVPPDDERSNFKQANDAMLSHVSPGSVFRMKGEAPNLDEAAREYESRLGDEPLDCVLLGVGPDGHVASLFPGSPQFDETERLCVATPISPTQPQLPRLTLTFPVLNRARLVIMLVTDAKKRDIVRRALDGDSELPASHVQPQDGRLVWLLDEATAPAK